MFDGMKQCIAILLFFLSITSIAQEIEQPQTPIAESPGEMLVQSARLRNAGVGIGLLMTVIGGAIASSAEEGEEDIATLGYGIAGGGLLVGVGFTFGGNNKQAKAGRKLKELGF